MDYPSTIQTSAPHIPSSFGEKLADRVAAVVGSWRFILLQSGILLLWLILNSVHLIAHWDNYPYVLLNLCLSFEAAFTAPIILMSQNRQSAGDRATFLRDLAVDEEDEQRIKEIDTKLDQVLTLLQGKKV